MKNLTKESFVIFWNHARKYPWAIFTITIGVLVSTLIDVYIPFWYKKFFDILSKGVGESRESLVDILVLILVLHGVSWVMWRIVSFTNNFFQPRVMSNLLNTCFQYLHGHSYTFFNNTFVGSLVKKVTRYSRAFEGLADQVYFNLGRTLIRTSFILAILFWLYWQIGLVVIVWSILFFLFQVWFARYKLKYDILKAQKDSETSAHLADTIGNQLNVKLFTGLKRESEAHKSITNEWFRIYKFSWDLDAIVEAVQAALMIILEFLVFYAAVRVWQKGGLTIGDFALIQAYLINIFDHFWDLGRQIRRIYEHIADAVEMTEILTTPHEIKDLTSASLLKVEKGGIEFNNLTFGYNPRQKVFKKFNLNILSGERVALIGPSGGGKTTIVKLLLRFMDIQGGQILIDGQNIATVTQDSLRANISLVPQEPVLFHRSLLENIGYAKPEASEEDIIGAAKLAHAHEFISTFPEKYQTHVGERGVKLSGGERQRVAIARAILKDAPILILDEATSSLDSESERYIQDALTKLMAHRTTVVIAHRLSTIMQMDRIVVIDKGKVVEEGKHEELLKIRQGIYQKLWGIQAGGFSQQ